ncbi:MAG TPA: Hint domain-containing protein, partial [Nitrosarchaeum sp.]|nr:Hint domain-containing protein [Nitrosarchaeum sp.]
VGEKASNGCTVEVTLLKINDNTATFLKKEYHDKPCPICLSEDTVIDTPNGQVNIKELHEGMDIFTQDTSGNKYVGTILKTGKTQVSPNHKMIHIVLADNRELYGSPKHPTTDGKVLEELSVGDILDGAKIKILEVVPYDGQYTFDILPSGSTGYYWANGILIKSTLN